MKPVLSLALVGLLLTATPALADVVFDESVSGDLGSTISPTPLGVLDTGVSTILGSLDGGPVLPDDQSPSSNGPDEFDSITFTTNLMFTVDLTALSPRNTTAALFQGSSVVDVSSVGTNIFGSQAAGEYRINLLPSGNDLESSYQLDINVVPLPASALLLAPALVGLGIMRRRRAATPAQRAG